MDKIRKARRKHLKNTEKALKLLRNGKRNFWVHLANKINGSKISKYYYSALLNPDEELENTKPFYNPITDVWQVDIDGRTEFGDINYIASEFTKDGLYFPFDDEVMKQNHSHTFEGVLDTLLTTKAPEKFSIENYKEYYSEQEYNLITKLKEKTVLFNKS